MPVAADLVAYASANMQDSDSGAQGGAIDLLRYVDFTQLASDDDVEVLSDSAGDTTQNYLVEARSTAGAFVSESVLLTGVTAVIFSTIGVVDRILSGELDATAAGVVTLRISVAGATVRALAIGKRGFMMFTRRIASDPVSITDWYSKFFWKNEHGSEDLTTAQIKQNADSEARVTHLLANSIDDTATSTDRTTAPAVGDTPDPDTFDDTDKTVPGTVRGFGEAIGVWLEVSLPAADPAHDRTSLYTSEITGNSI